MDCNKCVFKKDINDWIIFFRFMKMDKVKDYDAWKRFNDLYEFLKQYDCKCKDECDK